MIYHPQMYIPAGLPIHMLQERYPVVVYNGQV